MDARKTASNDRISKRDRTRKYPPTNSINTCQHTKSRSCRQLWVNTSVPKRFLLIHVQLVKLQDSFSDRGPRWDRNFYRCKTPSRKVEIFERDDCENFTRNRMADQSREHEKMVRKQFVNNKWSNANTFVFVPSCGMMDQRKQNVDV